MEEEWLPTPAAADILNVSVGHVAWLAARGHLVAERRTHHQWWMTRTSIEALAADRSSWMSWDDAAALVGCSRFRIATAVRDGRIESRAHLKAKQPSLRRASVEAYASTWAEQQRAASEQAQLDATQRATQPPHRPPNAPPDSAHVWLSTTEAALVLGLTRTGVRYRAHQNLIPHTIRHGRLWIRREHIEQAAAARAFQAQRQRTNATEDEPASRA